MRQLDHTQVHQLARTRHGAADSAATVRLKIRREAARATGVRPRRPTSPTRSPQCRAAERALRRRRQGAMSHLGIRQQKLASASAWPPATSSYSSNIGMSARSVCTRFGTCRTSTAPPTIRHPPRSMPTTAATWTSSRSSIATRSPAGSHAIPRSLQGADSLAGDPPPNAGWSRRRVASRPAADVRPKLSQLAGRLRTAASAGRRKAIGDLADFLASQTLILWTWTRWPPCRPSTTSLPAMSASSSTTC